MRSISVLCFIFAMIPIFSQTIIKGKVSYAGTKQAAEAANVVLQEKGKKTIASFTSTGEKGNFELKYKGTNDSLQVTVSGFNIKKQIIAIANHSQNLNFVVESENIQLKEVEIKPPKIKQKGDTLNYLVSGFSDANDRTIGDVLKKMPGIQVQKNGQILYQNKPINKFYIEDLDLLQGRYGIATNNIDAKQVATVQVLENHQPIKSLQDKELSDEAAINLKLKDSAKGVFFANAQVGAGGFPLISSNEATGMLFAKNRQDIVMYKGDNSGREIGNELNSFYSNGSRTSGTQKLLTVQSPAPPAISQQRYLFNDAHMGSLNHLNKLKKDYTLTTNINYLYDRPEKKSLSLSEYFLPGDSTLLVSDYSKSMLYKNRLNSNIQIESNEKEYYLNNELNINGEWDRETGNNFTVDTIGQYLKNPSFKIRNAFEYTKHNNNKTLRIRSTLQFEDLNQSLSVTPVLYSQLFSSDKTSELMRQRIDFRSFSTYNSVSWGTKLGINIDFKFDFNANIQHLKSNLSAISGTQAITADSLTNNLKWNTYEWTLTPLFGHKFSSKFNIFLHLPLRYRLLLRNNHTENKTADSGYFNANLFLTAHYTMSPMWNATAYYNYNNSLNDIQNAYTGYIMANYRNLLRNDSRINKQRIHNTMLYVNHKNPLTLLFANFSLDYSNIHSDLLNEYDYLGILRVKSSVEIPNTSQNLNASASVGKDILSLRSLISLRSGYRLNKSAQLSQGTKTDYQSQSITLSPSIVTRLSPKANLDYSIDMSAFWSKIDINTTKLPLIKTLSQKIKLNTFPTKKLVVGLSFENFYNSAISSGSRSMWFGDAGIRYRWKNTDLMLDYTNVFNTRKYITASYSNIGRYVNSYDLRPSEILFKVRFKLK